MNVTCIFSDDFRSESDGKYSIMGIYGGEIIIPTSSFILPRLSITAIVKNSIEEDDISQMSLEVRLNGRQALKQEIPPGDLEKVADAFRKQGIKTVQRTTNAMLTILPVAPGDILEAIITVNSKVMLKDTLTIGIRPTR